MKNQIVLINTLTEFLTEVPAPGPVRLNLTERRDARTYGSGRHKHQIPTLHVQLDLQAVNIDKEIVWLRESHELQLNPGGSGFWGVRDESVNRQMPRLKEIVAGHLEERGYTVHGGQYGMPATIKPINGTFDCVRWEADGERAVKLVIVESELHPEVSSEPVEEPVEGPA